MTDYKAEASPRRRMLSLPRSDWTFTNSKRCTILGHGWDSPPNNKISGGKVLSSKTSFSSNRIVKTLRLAANALYNSKSYLGNYFRKMRSRLGAPKAITATAHIVYSVLRNQTPCDESVFAVEELKYQEKLMKKLKKQASDLGLALVDVQTIPNAESA